MRFSPGSVLNLAAWAVVGLLIVGALLVANRLGFVGLILLGGATGLVCNAAKLNQDAPTWGTEVFKARMQGPRSSEQQAAMMEERQGFLSPLKFYGRCGMALTVIGLLGAAWQIWAS